MMMDVLSNYPQDYEKKPPPRRNRKSSDASKDREYRNNKRSRHNSIDTKRSAPNDQLLTPDALSTEPVLAPTVLPTFPSFQKTSPTNYHSAPLEITFPQAVPIVQDTKQIEASLKSLLLVEGPKSPSQSMTQHEATTSFRSKSPPATRTTPTKIQTPKYKSETLPSPPRFAGLTNSPAPSSLPMPSFQHVSSSSSELTSNVEPIPFDLNGEESSPYRQSNHLFVPTGQNRLRPQQLFKPSPPAPGPIVSSSPPKSADQTRSLSEMSSSIKSLLNIENP